MFEYPLLIDPSEIQGDYTLRYANGAVYLPVLDLALTLKVKELSVTAGALGVHITFECEPNKALSIANADIAPTGERLSTESQCTLIFDETAHTQGEAVIAFNDSGFTLTVSSPEHCAFAREVLASVVQTGDQIALTLCATTHWGLFERQVSDQSWRDFRRVTYRSDLLNGEAVSQGMLEEAGIDPREAVNALVNLETIKLCKPVPEASTAPASVSCTTVTPISKRRGKKQHVSPNQGSLL